MFTRRMKSWEVSQIKQDVVRDVGIAWQRIEKLIKVSPEYSSHMYHKVHVTKIQQVPPMLAFHI